MKTALTKGKKPNTVQLAEQIALPIAQQMGLELWDVRYEKEGTNWYLRFFIDKNGGVNIQDCTDFSHAVEIPWDAADPIEHSYTLEVCSPGIERQLIKDEHFQRYLGHKVTVKLIRPVDGVREFTGVLAAKDGDFIRILLEQDGEDQIEMTFLKKEASFVKLYADFDVGGQE